MTVRGAGSGIVIGVKFTAPITPLLRSEIERLAGQPLSAAQITRSAGVVAEGLGQRRPSYERVRTLVDEARHPARRVFAAAILLDFAFGIGRRSWWWSVGAGTGSPATRK